MTDKDEAPAAPDTVTRTAPEKIWLQISDDAEHCNEPFQRGEGEITWCEDSVEACQVAYVRADIAAGAARERARQAAPTTPMGKLNAAYRAEQASGVRPHDAACVYVQSVGEVPCNCGAVTPPAPAPDALIARLRGWVAVGKEYSMPKLDGERVDKLCAEAADALAAQQARIAELETEAQWPNDLRHTARVERIEQRDRAERAEAALAAETERCAKVCEDEALTYGPMNHRTMANAARACAAAIREQAKGD